MNSNPVSVTAAEVGLPEVEQLKVVLEFILSQGGIAIMPQIYDAVEAKLGDGYTLSDQGKHTLRAVVNTRAVKAGYIHPYDKTNPGWQITENGVAFIRRELGKTVGTVKVVARASVNFKLALQEIRTLLDLYEEIRQKSLQRDQKLEVLKRTGIILTVTAWETFIEDALQLSFQHQLNTASSPGDMQNSFYAIAQAWYDAILTKRDSHPKPVDFVNWTGDNWKQLIREKFNHDLISLNTPKTKNIRELSKKYLGIDITESWTWAGMSPQKVQRRLDTLIELRGELAHRIGNYFERGTIVQRKKLSDAIYLIEQLVKCTEEFLV